jgi:hypothetical protein
MGNKNAAVCESYIASICVELAETRYFNVATCLGSNNGAARLLHIEIVWLLIYIVMAPINFLSEVLRLILPITVQNR